MNTKETMTKSENTEYFQEASSLASRTLEAFKYLRVIPHQQRNESLLILSKLLQEKKRQIQILEANDIDIQKATLQGMSSSIIDRLKLNESRIEGMVTALIDIVKLPDPLGVPLFERVLENGIQLKKVSVPLGVILIIYESRPNVTIDVGALCIKSGNAAILRGGKEALHTNKALFELFQLALKTAGINENAIELVQNIDRKFTLALLQQTKFIDLVVPRGGEGLIQFVTEHSRIPIVKHDKGVCNIYIDESAAMQQALSITLNAKLQRPSVCNAAENLIVHRKLPFLDKLLNEIHKGGVALIGNEELRNICPSSAPLSDEDLVREYHTEYLDHRLSVKFVDGIEEAIEFIRIYGSGHSECIVSTEQKQMERFTKEIDSAAIFCNCSTRFHDGGAMGFGAEVGISTGKLHVRGPMALDHLTTTTILASGNGQIRN